MNLYFDTEFTGLVQKTELISIGIIADTGEMYYAELCDYDIHKCNDWVKENVITNLLCNQDRVITTKDLNGVHYIFGNTLEVRHDLLMWLDELRKKYGKVTFQMVSDCCHYDMVLFCDLMGGAGRLPEDMNAVCFDLSHMIMEECFVGVGNNFVLSHNMKDAFDVSREELVTKNGLELPHTFGGSVDKHNALYDACVIKLIYDELYFKKYYPRYREHEKIETLASLDRYDMGFTEKCKENKLITIGIDQTMYDDEYY
jgi:hypothetical protein